MLQFDYTAIQLNRLSWRSYVNQHNPVACALMAKMDTAVEDRPKVKLECLRLLATLKLDPAKAQLIGGFIESYLKLTGAEIERYTRELVLLTPDEQEETMKLLTGWNEEAFEHVRVAGRTAGRMEGKEELLIQLIRHQLGEVSARTLDRIDHLRADQLDELGIAFLSFKSTTDLDNWLSRQMPVDLTD